MKIILQIIILLGVQMSSSCSSNDNFKLNSIAGSQNIGSYISAETMDSDDDFEGILTEGSSDLDDYFLSKAQIKDWEPQKNDTIVYARLASNLMEYPQYDLYFNRFRPTLDLFFDDSTELSHESYMCVLGLEDALLWTAYYQSLRDRTLENIFPKGNMDIDGDFISLLNDTRTWQKDGIDTSKEILPTSSPDQVWFKETFEKVYSSGPTPNQSMTLTKLSKEYFKDTFEQVLRENLRTKGRIFNRNDATLASYVEDRNRTLNQALYQIKTMSESKNFSLAQVGRIAMDHIRGAERKINWYNSEFKNHLEARISVATARSLKLLQNDAEHIAQELAESFSWKLVGYYEGLVQRAVVAHLVRTGMTTASENIGTEMAAFVENISASVVTQANVIRRDNIRSSGKRLVTIWEIEKFVKK